jgi:DNA polymerase-3 subunit gamma/tau
MNNEQTVLYRKYRPQKFDEVFGQDHIVKVLKGSIELGNIGHAYLFSGPRGTGKTSVARIFAKEIGCSENDIIEIDAASNRGVDNIRDLREAVLSRPFDSEYKMYIIDEVHMLTKEAFNALLKTLEEPPSHVIFVLATTELHKVLPTIISRCQSFTFKSPTRQVLREMISGIAKKEGFTIDVESLDIISFLGNGSFRDTQGVLQKLISYSKDKKITREETELITGAPALSLLQDFIIALKEKDTDTLLSIIRSASSQNIDAHIFLQMLTEKIRTILRLRFSKKLHNEIKDEIGEDEFNFFMEIAKEKNEINAKLLSQLLKVYVDMQHAFIKYLPLELAIFRLFGDNSERT